MLFALLVLFSAFLIEGIGTYVSVVGLSSLFAANPVIITLAIALDIGKIVTVSFLYKYWKNVNWIMKSYMCIAAVVLMVITSAGAFGFLSGEFQKAIADTSSQNIVMTTLTDEQARLQARKNEIDKQISQLKTDNVKGRTQLMRQFGPEVGRVNKRLEEIDKELPKLKVESIKKNVEVGPIIYVAEAFHTTPEQAVKWVILIIIFVFDPLAVALLIAGNYLLELRKTSKDSLVDNPLPISPPLDTELVASVLRQDSSNRNVRDSIVDDANTSSEKTSDDKIIEGFLDGSLTVQETEDYVFGPNTEDVPSTTQLVHTVDESLAIIKDEIEEPIATEIVVDAPIEIVEEKIDTSNNLTALVEELEHTVSALTGEPFQLSAAPVAPVLDVTSDEHADREVITLEQITKPPVHRSSLEDIDAHQGDIHADEENRERSMKNIFTIYRD